MLTQYYEAPYVAGHPPQRPGDQRVGEAGDRASTTSGRRRDGRRLDAVGRQPAEGVVAREFSRELSAAGPRPADARPRRRQHRVHPSPGRRQARRGRGDPARLGRARRGPRAVRPHRGDVPRRDRRARRRADGRARGDRAADGRRPALDPSRSSPWPAPAAARTATAMTAARPPDLGPRRRPGRLDPARAAARLAPDHRLEPGDRARRINLLLPLVAYESLLQGATGLSFIDVNGRRDHASTCRSTPSRRPGR